MKAAHRPHIIVSENPLIEGQDYTSLCQKPVSKAYFVRTDGDLRIRSEWNNAIMGACRKCFERLDERKKVHVYFAVDGQLAEMYQKSDVPEIQREA
jgi:hypothetical protein